MSPSAPGGSFNETFNEIFIENVAFYFSDYPEIWLEARQLSCRDSSQIPVLFNLMLCIWIDQLKEKIVS